MVESGLRQQVVQLRTTSNQENCTTFQLSPGRHLKPTSAILNHVRHFESRQPFCALLYPFPETLICDHAVFTGQVLGSWAKWFSTQLGRKLPKTPRFCYSFYQTFVLCLATMFFLFVLYCGDENKGSLFSKSKRLFSYIWTLFNAVICSA